MNKEERQLGEERRRRGRIDYLYSSTWATVCTIQLQAKRVLGAGVSLLRKKGENRPIVGHRTHDVQSIHSIRKKEREKHEPLLSVARVHVQQGMGLHWR